MGEFTAEDFEVANLATRGEYMVARRCGGDLAPWAIFLHNRPALYVSDASMVHYGWTPVVEGEAHDRIETLLDTKKIHERVIAELRHDMSLARREIVDLRDENDRLERILQAPLSLKDLRVAWDAAEQAEECREGDVLMTRHPDDNYEVWVAVGAFDISRKTRILSRAPQREPWADLADVLTLAEGDIGGLNVDAVNVAAILHERGVRVTGGEDS